jgi:hypothetical protein
MKTEDIKKMALAWKEVQEAANKKLDPVGKADADIDNDGDTDKSDEYLHNRRKAVSAAIKGKGMKEESEQIDELSKKTLGSYVKKAAGDAVTKAYRAGDVRDKDSGKNYMKALGRQIGISTATSKLAKEEVEELDELSKKTLGSYVKKASRNLAGREYKRGAEKDASMSNLQKSYKRDMGIAKAVDKLTKEEVEQIDELKKSTLGSYVKKASTNQIGNTAAVLANKNDSETDRARKRMGNRMAGIAKATDKLTKEEVELDEASNIGDAYMKHLHTKYNDKKSLSKSETEEVKDMMTRHTIADVKKLAGSGIRHVSDAAKNHVKRYVPGSMKKEETEIEEKKLTPKQIKAALGAVKAKPKDQVSVAKAPWDMKKEDTQRWRVYNKILEADAHLKGATPPEAIDSKASQGEKDFVKLHGGLNGNDSGIDGAKAAADTAKNAAAGVKVAPKRPSDNPAGDKSVIKSTEAK